MSPNAREYSEYTPCACSHVAPVNDHRVELVSHSLVALAMHRRSPTTHSTERRRSLVVTAIAPCYGVRVTPSLRRSINDSGFAIGTDRAFALGHVVLLSAICSMPPAALYPSAQPHSMLRSSGNGWLVRSAEWRHSRQ